MKQNHSPPKWGCFLHPTKSWRRTKTDGFEGVQDTFLTMSQGWTFRTQAHACSTHSGVSCPLAANCSNCPTSSSFGPDTRTRHARSGNLVCPGASHTHTHNIHLCGPNNRSAPFVRPHAHSTTSQHQQLQMQTYYIHFAVWQGSDASQQAQCTSLAWKTSRCWLLHPC